MTIYEVYINGNVRLLDDDSIREMLEYDGMFSEKDIIDNKEYFRSKRRAAAKAKEHLRNEILMIKQRIADINADLNDNKGRYLPKI